MRRFTGVIATAIPSALLTACAVSATAQDHRFGVELGISNLTAAHGAADSLGFHIGAQARLSNTALLSRMGRSTIDFDFNHNSGGGSIDLAALSYVERWPIGRPNPGSGIVPYVGLGVGVGYTAVTRQFVTPGGGQPGGGQPGGGQQGGGGSNPSQAAAVRAFASRAAGTVDVSSDRVQVVGKLLGGVSFSQRYYVEAAYIFGGDSLGARSDSVNVALGVHF